MMALALLVFFAALTALATLGWTVDSRDHSGWHPTDHGLPTR